MGYWVMLVSDRAQAAANHGDLASAVKYYRALVKAVPDRAVGFVKLCGAYEAMGDLDRAVTSCKAALEREGASVEDYTHALTLLMSKPGDLKRAEVADTDKILAHLQTALGKQASGGVLVERSRCELALRLEDRKRLEACSAALRTLAPQDPSSIAFPFALALMRRDFAEAEHLIAMAKRHGWNDRGVQQMQLKLQSELDRQPFWRRLLGMLCGPAAFSSVVLALVGVLWLARRHTGLRTSARPA
jgi:hypothetical protein